MAATIVSLFQYPLQGAQGQAVDAMNLATHTAPPLDRVFGIVEAIKHITAAGTQVIHKLRGDRLLLTLRANYEKESKTLTIHDANKKLIASATMPKDDKVIAAAIAKFLGYHGDHPLSVGYKSDPSLFGGFVGDRAVIAGAYKKTDISIINLASVRELTQKAAPDNDANSMTTAQRFRGNIYIDGLAPFAELSWVGGTITCGGVTLRVVERTTRCAITEINPDSGQRDFSTLTHLKKHYHHLDMGVYADVITSGTIAIGDIAAPL